MIAVLEAKAMTPELLALLTPEQQEVWRIHGIASYMPSAYVADALLQLAQMKRDFRDCVKSHQKANAELEMLWAAVADAPHGGNCANRKSRISIPFERFKNPICKGAWALGSACGRCEKCEFTRLPTAFESDPCDCWKSETK